MGDFQKSLMAFLYCPSLSTEKTINEGSTISTQPVVANGIIYWGSWDGMEHATKLDGTQAWTTNLGTAPSNCGGALGVLSTATIATETINGTSTLVDFVGSANNTFYALNASTGAIIWQTSLGTPATQVLWSSPVLYNGSIYIGIASNDCPLVQGQVFQLNATPGAIQNTFNVVPNGCLGAVLRRADAKNWYRALINGTNLIIQKKVNGTLTLLGKTAFAATAGTSYTLRFSIVGSTLSAKVWQTCTTEPASWMITLTDSSLLSGRCGIYLQVQSTVTADITSFLATKP